jgi:hypothetical protein
MLSKTSACSSHRHKCAKPARTTKARDPILRTSSSLYSSLEGFQRKSYCPCNVPFCYVSDLRPAGPAKSGVRRAALPRFVGPLSRSRPPVTIAQGFLALAILTHIFAPARHLLSQTASAEPSGSYFGARWKHSVATVAFGALFCSRLV